jgi:TPR repeat protein
MSKRYLITCFLLVASNASALSQKVVYDATKFTERECRWLYSELLNACVESQKCGRGFGEMDLPMSTERGMSSLETVLTVRAMAEINKACERACLGKARPAYDSWRTSICMTLMEKGTHKFANPGTTSSLPQFESFSVGTIYDGPTANPKLSTQKARKFRSRLIQAGSEKANFAGHYILVQWGCGTTCASGAALDAISGQITLFPFVYVCCWREVESEFHPIDFRLHSRLIVFKGQLHEEGELGAHYFTFDGGRFKFIKTVSLATDGLTTNAAEDANRTADCERQFEDKRYQEAEACWRIRAQRGDLEAQFQLGKLYYHGEEIGVDKKQAAAWFTTAAERGSVSAQSFLALMYLTGDGVSQSPETAIKWYEAAAKGGDLSAAQNLAFHFKQGTLLPRDLERSLYWCKYFADRQRKDQLPSEFQDGCEKWLTQTN